MADYFNFENLGYSVSSRENWGDFMEIYSKVLNIFKVFYYFKKNKKT